MDSFGWADIDTGLAVHTHILVNFCFFIIHGNCRCGTFIHTCFASGTFLGINNCYHSLYSTVIFCERQKIGFVIEPGEISGYFPNSRTSFMP